MVDVFRPTAMFRTALGLRALPRARASMAKPAWREVWTRFFTSETSHAITGAGSWQSSTGPLQLLRNFTRHSARRPSSRTWRSAAGRMQQRAFRFSPWTRSTNGPGDKMPEKLSLGARLKKLSKEYGWSAVGVYLGLSVLDFPFCFLLVRIVGTDTIGQSCLLLSCLGGNGRANGTRESCGTDDGAVAAWQRADTEPQANLSTSSFPTSRPSSPSGHGRGGTSIGTPSRRQRASSWATMASATRWRWPAGGSRKLRNGTRRKPVSSLGSIALRRTPGQAGQLIRETGRSGDATGARLRNPQELHLCASAADGGGHA